MESSRQLGIHRGTLSQNKNFLKGKGGARDTCMDVHPSIYMCVCAYIYVIS
jgi:hypothetical protein